MDLHDYDAERDLSLAGTLPKRWYVDSGMLSVELERIFRKTWQPVARAEDLLRRGDFVTCDAAGEPMVVTRGTDDILRAFSNVCRHRAGSVATGKGNRKSLQCRYHGWTYGLDGRLLTQPEFEGVGNWNPEKVCLPAAEVETWGPYVFLNLDAHPLPFSEVLGAIPDDIGLAGFPVDRMQFVERRDYLVKCNWKVYIDNYLEGYHIPIAHPGLFREIDYAQYRVETFRYYSSAYAPIRPAKEGDIAGRDRRYVRTEAESRALYYWIFPNFMINVYPDNLQANIVLPVGHEQTLTIFEWFFLPPGSGEGWESLQQSIAFSDQIQREDMELCESVQRNFQSLTYDRGRFSARRENGVHHFHLLLHEFLSEGSGASDR